MEYTKYIEKSLRRILIMSIVCFVFSLGSLVFYFCYRVEPVTDRFVIELGDPVSEDLYDYITGMDWAKPRIAKQKGIYLLNTST